MIPSAIAVVDNVNNEGIQRSSDDLFRSGHIDKVETQEHFSRIDGDLTNCTFVSYAYEELVVSALQCRRVGLVSACHDLEDT